ncbi:transketolase [Lactonifactor longoviformis]|uniref:transketolase n=1 Tax=Lactonifactor longoviformis TaxID=341220 RepID=UPI0034E3BBBB
MTSDSITMKDLQIKSYDLRKNIVDIVLAGNGGHIGGDMSVLEILMTLYFKRMNIHPNAPEDPNRDRFILSKGHAMEAYYAVLAEKGFLNLQDILSTFSQYNSPYIGHPNNRLPGIEMNSGSLGHGLPVAAGMALAAKRSHKSYRTYVVMGDGELAEGSVWEAAMAASNYKLDNLCAVVDRNRLQISGNTEDVMALDDLHNRFAAFNWNVIGVADGNSIIELDVAFEQAEAFKGKPSVLIANTVKGFGSSVMEHKANWHHKVPSGEEYQQIISDFKARKESLL